MKHNGWTLGMLAVFGLLASLALAPSAGAFHGSWWKGFGTAQAGVATLQTEFLWGGQDVIVTCGGGGCLGEGDGSIIFRDASGQTVATHKFVGVEDVRNVIFINDPTWCPSQAGFPNPLEVTPQYKLLFDGGELTGIQRNCLSTGINKNDFSGAFGPFLLSIHAEGGFGISHG
jgi:hypothetical protein